MSSSFFFSDEFIGFIQVMVANVFFGGYYVAIRGAMINERAGVLTFNACRYAVSTISVIVAKVCLDLSKLPKKSAGQISDQLTFSAGSLKRKYSLFADFCTFDVLLWGFIIAVANVGSSSATLLGVKSESASKSVFIISLYVVLTPIGEWLLKCFSERPNPKIFILAIISVFGLYLISGCTAEEGRECFTKGESVGELWLIMAAIFWTVYFLVSASGSERVPDAMNLTIVNFIFATLLSLVLAWFMEPEQWISPYEEIKSNYLYFIIAGVCQAFGLLLISFSMNSLPPSRVALLNVLEVVCVAILAYFILGEFLNWIEFLGGLIIFTTAVLTVVNTDSCFYSYCQDNKELHEYTRILDREDVEVHSTVTLNGWY